LLSLNEGFDRHAIDILLALDELNEIAISGDGMLHIPDLVNIPRQSRGLYM
jgi:hypothetical protein